MVFDVDCDIYCSGYFGLCNFVLISILEVECVCGGLMVCCCSCFCWIGLLFVVVL